MAIRTARRTTCHDWAFKSCKVQPGFQFSPALKEWESTTVGAHYSWANNEHLLSQLLCNCKGMFNWVCKYILPMWRNVRIAELEYSSTVHWHTFIFMFTHAKTPPPSPCRVIHCHLQLLLVCFSSLPLLYFTLSLVFNKLSFLLILFNKHTMAPGKLKISYFPSLLLRRLW